MKNETTRKIEIEEIDGGYRLVDVTHVRRVISDTFSRREWAEKEMVKVLAPRQAPVRERVSREDAAAVAFLNGNERALGGGPEERW